MEMAPRRVLLSALLVLGLATASALSWDGGLVVHRRRECRMDTLARTAFADVDALDALFDRPLASANASTEWTRVDSCDSSRADQACANGRHVSLVDGKLSFAASASAGGARVSAAVNASAAWNSTARLRVHAAFPREDNSSVSTIALSLPNFGASLSLSVAGSRIRLGSASHNLSVEIVPPCESSDVKTHIVDLEWTPSRWLRWHWDGHLLHEMKLPERSATKGDILKVDLSASSTSTKSPASVALYVSKVEIQRVADGQDEAVCRPHVLTPDANCRHRNHFKPRLGEDQGYLSLAQVYEYVQNVSSQFPPGFTKLEEIGKSNQNRSLVALCLGACDVADAPQVLFTGMHHSREPISMMNLIYTIDLLAHDLANGVVDIAALLLSRQLWFVLVVNPDGYARNEELKIWELHKAGQRKNTRSEGGCSSNPADGGVDLNRNYDVCFDQDNEGSSTNPCGEDYRGPAPFSEPETLAIKQFVEKDSSHFSVSLNYHSFGRYFNVPFACKALDTPQGSNLTVFEMWAKEMTRYNGFSYGQPWKDDNLYSVNGETSDWLWIKHGIFSMSPEVGPAFSTRVDQGFWPSRETVPALAAELHYSNLVAARFAGPIYEVFIHNITRIPAAEDNEGPQALLQIALELRNRGLRAAGDVDIIVTTALIDHNGTQTYSTSKKVGAAELGTVRDGERLPASHFLAIPESSILHVVLRDSLSCQYTRVTVVSDEKEVLFEQWHALDLPPCTFCRSLERDADELARLGASPACQTIDDLVQAQTLSLATVTSGRVSDHHNTDSETREANPVLTPQPIVKSETPSSMPTPTPMTSSQSPTTPTSEGETLILSPSPSPNPSPSPHLSLSYSPSPSTLTTTPSLLDSLSPHSSPTTSTDTTLNSTTTASGDSISFTSFITVPVIATVVVVVLVVAFFALRHRRRLSSSKTSGGSGGSAKPGQRKNYVKVVNNEDEANDEEAEDDSTPSPRAPQRKQSDDEDAEYGRRSNASRSRGLNADGDVV